MSTRCGVAGWLKKAREYRGWSQEQLAGVSGVPQQTISRYELGESTKPVTLRRLARVITGSEEKARVIVVLSEMDDLPVEIVRHTLDVMDLSERDRGIVFGQVEIMKRIRG